MPPLVDLAGQTFGRWTVVERVGSDRNGKVMWRCRCECENEKLVSGRALTNDQSRSCGCLQRELASVRHLINLTGQTFGRLTVLSRAVNSRINEVQWLCRCSCENEKVIRGHSLIRGETNSCGCLNRELVTVRIATLSTTHGQSKTLEYQRSLNQVRRSQKNAPTFFPDDISIEALIERDGPCCGLCGVDTAGHVFKLPNGEKNPHYATVGHVIPYTRGGTHHLNNVRVECYWCNCAKRDRLDEELYTRERQQKTKRFPVLMATMKKARKRRRVPSEPVVSLF